LFVICVLGTSCTASAQNNAASWQNLNALRVGEKIQVLEGNSTKVSGTFLNLSNGAISVQQEAGSQAIPRQDVVSVKLMKNNTVYATRSLGPRSAPVRERRLVRRGTTGLLREA